MKSPKVKIVSGKVRRIRIGLSIALTIPKIKAVTSAAVKLSTTTPGKTFAKANITRVDTSQLISINTDKLYHVIIITR